ncbi:hypothetical protein [Streptococcus saliviloxodontae]|uniref:Uncharacterized protein n=1 Tax=Streptococcus saliviloxodontae TaxID=1349416 RepID=A0ABS2PMH5_9STRE|nr:hypothetical protein [Streptococcus saliviloxodontae]MBM7636638.1 hypothetical protein [Streptococcus saliviloxodontae]
MTKNLKQLLETSTRCVVSFDNIDTFPLQFQKNLWSLLCFLRDHEVKWLNGEAATSDSMVSTVVYTIEHYHYMAKRLGTVTPALTQIALQFETVERYNGRKWDEEEETFYEDYDSFYGFTWLKEVPDDAIPFEEQAQDFKPYYDAPKPEETLDLSGLASKFTSR